MTASTTYVFRIEHTKSRHGPFCDNGGAYWYSATRDWDAYPNCYDMPAPHEESEHWPLHNYARSRVLYPSTDRFAFKHINGLLRWFGCPSGRAALQKHDFTLGIYKVPKTDVVPGEDQCVFRLTSAKHVADVSLTSDLPSAVTQAISLASN